jgi:hypothetical protein
MQSSGNSTKPSESAPPCTRLNGAVSANWRAFTRQRALRLDHNVEHRVAAGGGGHHSDAPLGHIKARGAARLQQHCLRPIKNLGNADKNRTRPAIEQQ